MSIIIIYQNDGTFHVEDGGNSTIIGKMAGCKGWL
jgi:hypothetical protein